jgi:uncharacterized LabA/DUF88 family protein
VYVDGFNLYFGLRAAGLRRYYWLDLVSLAQRLLKPGQTLARVHYFTARIRLVSGGVNAADVRRQSDYLDALDTLPLLERQEGHFLEKQARCKACGATWTTYEEKMSDVNLATQMLLDAVDDRFDTALVVSGDSDLATPIRNVLRRCWDKRVVVVFPPKRNSAELQRAASGHLRLGEDKLRNSLLPDPVLTPAGVSLRQPETWR